MNKLFLISSVLLMMPVANANDYPAPMKLIIDQGGEIISSFKAPESMTGYVIDFRGKALLLYATQSGKYIFTGNMLNAYGEEQGEKALEAYIKGEKNERDWAKLSSSNWVPDGSDNAEIIIYAFMDPNCPYCKQFWQAARPWVDAGKVQVRHIMVGILSQDSSAKTAALLGSDKPEQMLFEHLQGNNTIKPNYSPTPNVLAKMQRNLETMQTMGASATPTIFYRNKDGLLSVIRGLPQAQMMSTIMGGPKS